MFLVKLHCRRPEAQRACEHAGEHPGGHKKTAARYSRIRHPIAFERQDPEGNSTPAGEALIVALGPDEFLVTGVQCRVDFSALAAADGKKGRMWLSVEEGSYADGVWKRSRLWNGDQTDYGSNFTAAPQVLRVRLLAYQGS